VAGDEEQLIAERLRQEGWYRDRLALRAEDEAGQVFDHEGKPERQEQAVERVASIERPDQYAFDGKANDCGQGRGEQERAPEAHIG
jgi:hypothetical protein